MDVTNTSRTGCAFVLISVLCCPALLAAPPTVAQSIEESFAGRRGRVTLPQPVSGGNLLTVQIVQWDANGGNRTASVQDNLGNVYVRAARQAGSSASGGNCVEEWYAKNVTGGTATATVNYGLGNVTTFSVLLKELAGADAVSPLDQTATFDERGTNLTKHACAPSAGLTTAASVYISATSALSGQGGKITAGRSYTQLASGAAQVVYLDQSSPSVVSGTRGDFSTSIPRGGCGCLVSYKASAGGSSGSVFAPRRMQSAESSLGGTSGSLTLPQPVAAGNLLTVQIVQYDANGGHRTASVQDNLGNDYVRAARQVGSWTSGSQCAEEWYAKNVKGGTVTVTVKYRPGNRTTFDLLLKELAGADTDSPLDQSATFDEGAVNLNQHDCAPPAGITTAANVYVSGTSALNSFSGGTSAGRGYRELIASSTSVVYLEQSSAVSLAATRGDYTTSIARRGCGCLVSYRAPASAPPDPKTLYVATNGSDANPGTLSQPLLTVAAAVARVPSGGAIFVRAGTYPTTGTLTLAAAGVQVAAMTGETATITHGDYSGPIFDVSAESVRIQNLILDGQFVSQSRAIVGEASANLLTIGNCEIKQFGNDAVALDGADCKLDGCQIHDCLWWDAAAGIQAAHGVTTLNAQRLMIHDCTVYQVSGDSFFADQGAWQDVVIDGCTFYDAQLESAMAGFPQGVYVSESAVATRHGATAPRARLTIRNSSLHGFNSDFVESSTLNLEQQIDVVVDSCDVHDSHIALRLAGQAPDVGAWPTIFNCTIHDCATAVRYENDVHNLHLAFNTFNNCATLFVPVLGNTQTGWIVQNNLFVGVTALPQEAPGPANVIPATGSINLATLAPTTSVGLLGSPAPPNAVPLWYPPITKDKAGVVRSLTAPTMGAYEFVGSSPDPPATGSPGPPPTATVQSTHPRFWGTTAEFEDILAKATTPEGRAIVAAALACAQGGPDASGDRLLCGAFIYRFGALLGVDPATCQALGTQAVADLMETPVALLGVEADVGWGGVCWAIGYDWLFPLLTADQKNALIRAATARLETRGHDAAWTGLNQLSGDVPMAAALATYGETAKEYVSDVYQNNWFASKAPFWNYAWQKTAWRDGGNHEGLGYYLDACYSNFGTRGLWETATGGDESLDMGFFRAAPYWLLFQLEPDDWALVYTATFAGGTDRQRWPSILKACTRFSDDQGKRLARWLLDETVTWRSQRTAGDGLLFGLLIGDPRIEGARPEALGIPLSFTMAQPGEFFARADWTPLANVVWFGNHTTGSRVTPAGEFALYSKGAYLFGTAVQRVAHSYGSRWLQPGVCFIQADGTPAFGVVDVGSVPDYVQRGTFQASTAQGATTIVAETAPNFNAPNGTIARATRTFSVDAAISTVTLTDNVLCDASLTPHLVFPCPTQPALNADGTVTITNGAASCTLSFSTPPVALIPVGGRFDYCDGLPGTAFAGIPYLLPLTVLDADFARLAASNNPADQAAALKQMGYWRLHVVLPAGGGAMTTTITVH